MCNWAKKCVLAATVLVLMPITIVCDLPVLDDAFYFEPYRDDCYYDGYRDCDWFEYDDEWFFDFDWWW